MLPALHIGPWQFSTYILAYVLAAFGTDLVCLLRLLRLGAPLLLVLRLVLLVTVAGFVSAYLVRLVPSVQHWVQAGSWEWIGGSSFAGGLLGGTATFVALCRWQGIPVARAVDQVLPVLALAQAIGRLGCLAAGCCYGRLTSSWLGLYLPDNQGAWAVRYPTQILSAAANLAIFFVLLRIEARAPSKNGPPGRLALLFVAFYCLERFLGEFLRADALPAIGPISWAQLYTTAGLILAIVLLARSARFSAAVAVSGTD